MALIFTIIIKAGEFAGCASTIQNETAKLRLAIRWDRYPRSYFWRFPSLATRNIGVRRLIPDNLGGLRCWQHPVSGRPPLRMLRSFSMAGYFKRDIVAWMDGTESLTDGQYRVYDVVLNLIYLQEGPIVAHEAGIAGRCNMHRLAYRSHLSALIERGKLFLKDGKLSNQRAEAEIAKIGKNPHRTSRQPRPDPPATPRRPPRNPPQTPPQPPFGSSDKLLKTNNPDSLLTRLDETRLDETLRKKGRSRASPRAPLPDGWTLSITDFEFAARKGFDHHRASELGEAFESHHRGKGNEMANWSAAWRTWVINEIKFNVPKNGGLSREATQQLSFGSLAMRLRARAASGSV